MIHVTQPTASASMSYTAQQKRDLLVIAVCGVLAVGAVLLQDAYQGRTIGDQPPGAINMAYIGD